MIPAGKEGLLPFLELPEDGADLPGGWSLPAKREKSFNRLKRRENRGTGKRKGFIPPFERLSASVGGRNLRI
jgi:hypothetical protein